MDGRAVEEAFSFLKKVAITATIAALGIGILIGWLL